MDSFDRADRCRTPSSRQRAFASRSLRSARDELPREHRYGAPEYLADQVATIIVAGHETTAAALFWSLYLLAITPAEQDALAAEAETVDLGPAAAADAAPQLVRTRAFVDEVLRLYPPAFVIVRQATEEDIAAGIPIPASSLVLIAPWVLHRHRRVWQDPDSFAPSRFLPGAPPPPRFAYMPFGIGRALALVHSSR